MTDDFIRDLGKNAILRVMLTLDDTRKNMGDFKFCGGIRKVLEDR